MWCNVGFAETEHTLNYYTKKGYKIIKIIGGPKNKIQHFVLQDSLGSGKSRVVICTVLLDINNDSYTTGCLKP